MKRKFLFGLLALGIFVGGFLFFGQIFQNIPCVNAGGEGLPPCVATLKNSDNYLGYIIGQALHINADGSGIGYMNFTQMADNAVYGVCVNKAGQLSGQAWTDGHGKLSFGSGVSLTKELCGGDATIGKTGAITGCGQFNINTIANTSWVSLNGLTTASNIFEAGLNSAVNILGSFTGSIAGQGFLIESKNLQFVPDGVSVASISISPASATVKTNVSASFTATVKDASDKGILWNILYEENGTQKVIDNVSGEFPTWLSASASGSNNEKLTIKYLAIPPSSISSYYTSGAKKQYIRIIAKAKADETKTVSAQFFLDETDADAPRIEPQNPEIYLGKSRLVLVKNADTFCLHTTNLALDLAADRDLNGCVSTNILSGGYEQTILTKPSHPDFCGLLNQTYGMTASNSVTGKTGNGNVIVRNPYDISCDEIINPVDKTKKKITVSCIKADPSTQASAFVTIDGEKIACDGSITKDVSSDTSVSSASISFPSSVSCGFPISCGQSTGKPSDFRSARVSANSTHLTWKDTTSASATGYTNTLVRLRLTPTSTESKNVKVNDVDAEAVKLSWTNATTWTPYETRIQFSPTSTFATGTVSKIATNTSATGTTVTGLTELTNYFIRLRACSPINPKAVLTNGTTTNLYTKWKSGDVSGTLADVCQLKPSYATTSATATLPIAPSNFEFADFGETSVSFLFTDNSKKEDGYAFYLGEGSSAVLMGTYNTKTKIVTPVGGSPYAMVVNSQSNSVYAVNITAGLSPGTTYKISIKAFGKADGDTSGKILYSKPLVSNEFTTDYKVTINIVGPAVISVSGCSYLETVPSTGKTYICEGGEEKPKSQFIVSGTSAIQFSYDETNVSLSDSGGTKTLTVSGPVVITGTLCTPFSVTFFAMPGTVSGTVGSYNTDDLPKIINSDDSCRVSITAQSKPGYSVYWAGCGIESDLNCTKTTGGNVYVGYFKDNGNILLSSPGVDLSGQGDMPRFAWDDSISEAHYYELCIANDAPGCVRTVTTTSKSVIPSGSLSPGIIYWFVSAKRAGDGTLIAQSPTRVFGYQTMLSSVLQENKIAEVSDITKEKIVIEKNISFPTWTSNIFDAMGEFVSKNTSSLLGAKEALMGNVLGVDHFGNNLQASIISKNPVKEMYDMFSTILEETNSLMSSMVAYAAGEGCSFGEFIFSNCVSKTYPNKPIKTNYNVIYSISGDVASFYDTNLEPEVTYLYKLTENGNTYYTVAQTLPIAGANDKQTEGGINQCQKHNVCSKATRFQGTPKVEKTDWITLTPEQISSNNECANNSDCDYVGKFEQRGGQER